MTSPAPKTFVVIVLALVAWIGGHSAGSLLHPGVVITGHKSPALVRLASWRHSEPVICLREVRNDVRNQRNTAREMRREVREAVRERIRGRKDQIRDAQFVF